MRTIKQEHYFPIIILIHFVFWIIDLYLYNGSYEYTSKHIAGEVFSSWVVTVFAANFLMATRARWVEKIFGGLDKMYLIHRRSGVIAVVLLLFHFIVVPRDPSFTIGKPMGFYSLVLILNGVIPIPPANQSCFLCFAVLKLNSPNGPSTLAKIPSVKEVCKSAV